MQQSTTLTAKHYRLYDLIKKETMDGKTLTVKDICDRLPEYWHVEIEDKHHTNCPDLYQTITELNLSDKTHLWISTAGNRIHISTKSDFTKEEIRLKKQVSRAQKQLYRLRKKKGNHNQLRLFTEDLTPIDESDALNYIRAWEKE